MRWASKNSSSVSCAGSCCASRPRRPLVRWAGTCAPRSVRSSRTGPTLPSCGATPPGAVRPRCRRRPPRDEPATWPDSAGPRRSGQRAGYLLVHACPRGHRAARRCARRSVSGQPVRHPVHVRRRSQRGPRGDPAPGRGRHDDPARRPGSGQAHQPNRTPGFRIPSGSNAFLTRRMSATVTGSAWSRK